MRDDLDRDAARIVVLGGKLIARNANRPNLCFGRQGAPFEPVDTNDRAGAGHILQLLLQRRRVIRQRLNLIPGERGSK